MTNILTTFNNNFGILNGIKLLNKFFKGRASSTEDTARYYHQGLKSILNNDDEDTVFCNGILISAGGMSPRLLMFK